MNSTTEETQETALTLSCCGGFLPVVQYLVGKGADIEQGGSTPLMEAAQEGHLDVVSYLARYQHLFPPGTGQQARNLHSRRGSMQSLGFPL